MKNSLFIILIAASINSCGGAGDTQISKEREGIAKMEDSLRMHPSTSNVPKMALIEKYLEFQKKFPQDESAPECLDKAHMVYSGVGLYVKSAAIADQLIKEYPKYVNRAMVLESQATNYDYFIIPRDSAKVRYYYNLLLKENPKLDKEKKDQILFRLKNNHLSLDQFIEKQSAIAK